MCDLSLGVTPSASLPYCVIKAMQLSTMMGMSCLLSCCSLRVFPLPPAALWMSAYHRGKSVLPTPCTCRVLGEEECGQRRWYTVGSKEQSGVKANENAIRLVPSANLPRSYLELKRSHRPILACEISLLKVFLTYVFVFKYRKSKLAFLSQPTPEYPFSHGSHSLTLCLKHKCKTHVKHKRRTTAISTCHQHAHSLSSCSRLRLMMSSAAPSFPGQMNRLDFCSTKYVSFHCWGSSMAL